MALEEVTQLREQCRAQELDIYRLRAKNGWLAAQIARLTRDNSTLRYSVEALRRKLGDDVVSQAEAAFRQ